MAARTPPSWVGGCPCVPYAVLHISVQHPSASPLGAVALCFTPRCSTLLLHPSVQHPSAPPRGAAALCFTSGSNELLRHDAEHGIGRPEGHWRRPDRGRAAGVAFSRVGCGLRLGRAWAEARSGLGRGRVGLGPRPGRAWAPAGSGVGLSRVGLGPRPGRVWAPAVPGLGRGQVGRGRRLGRAWAEARSGVGAGWVGRRARQRRRPDPAWAPWCPGGSYSQNGGTSKTSARATTAAERCAASASATKEGSGSMVRDQ